MTTKVLVIDDSVVVRRLLARMLGDQDDIEVVGTARDGETGLEMLSRLKPDVVTLDVEMPGIGGLGTLKEIRKLDYRLPVVMFSTLCERGASVTMEALTLGASDYATKPTGALNLRQSLASIEADLVPKIRQLAESRRRPAPAAPAEQEAKLRSPTVDVPISVVVVGISTGGPDALANFMPQLGRELAVPVVVVQHMPPLFTELLANRLDRICNFPVKEAKGNEILLPGTAWLAPGDWHLRIERGGPGSELSLKKTKEPPENSCRPAVDVLFRSAVETCGANVLGVVMTGMGRDGALGARQIVDAGGAVLAQDAETSVVWGMPGAVVQAGLAEFVSSPDQLAFQVRRRVKDRASGEPVASGLGEVR